MADLYADPAQPKKKPPVPGAPIADTGDMPVSYATGGDLAGGVAPAPPAPPHGATGGDLFGAPAAPAPAAPGGPATLGNPHDAAPPTAVQPPAGGEDLQTIMARRMAAVQSGQPDPGAGPAAPVADASPMPMSNDPIAQPAPPQAAPGEPLGSGMPTGPNAPPANGNPFQTALLKMLGDAGTPASLNDPALKAQSDAAAVGLTRGTEAGRAALAERMAQAGGPGVDSGAFNADLAGLFSQQGEQQAGINAGLVGDAQQRKDQQLTQAIGMGQAAHEFEANYGLEGKRLAETIRQFDTSTQAGKDALKQQLEMFKAQQAEQGRQFDVDATMKKLGIETQANLGSRDLALRDKLGTGGLNAQILQMLMQNDQFGKGEAGTNARFSAGQNNNYLQALLSQLGA